MDLNQINKVLPSVVASNTAGETRLFESRGGKRRTNKKKGGAWFSSGPTEPTECSNLRKKPLNISEQMYFKNNCNQYQGGKKRSTKKRRTNKKKGGKSRRARRTCF